MSSSDLRIELAALFLAALLPDSDRAYVQVGLVERALEYADTLLEMAAEKGES